MVAVPVLKINLLRDIKVCICGGGALGHVISATMASHDGWQVNLLTGHPEGWAQNVKTSILGEREITGRLNLISSEAKEAVTDMDCAILCVPGYMVSSTLRKIKPFLKPGAVVGSIVSSNGFFWMAKSILPKENPYFGLQRVPYIARVTTYGHRAELKGYKKELKVAVSEDGDKEAIRKMVEMFFGTTTVLLPSFWAAALTNSNPLLHTARLYALFKDYSLGVVYKEAPLFYEDWDEESSKLLIGCDNEFQQILHHLPVDAGEIPSVLSHYDSTDAESLTRKLRSIQAFKGIRLNMVKTGSGFIPDWNNRYFAEDIPYGLLIVKSFAVFFAIPTPHIDRILYWAQEKMGKSYMIDGRLTGSDVADTGVPENYVSSIQDLLSAQIS